MFLYVRANVLNYLYGWWGWISRLVCRLHQELMVNGLRANCISLVGPSVERCTKNVVTTVCQSRLDQSSSS